MQIGRMMETDAGKISDSFSSPVLFKSGTRIIPPPAENNPLTIPAKAPAMPVLNAFFKKIASCGSFSTGGDLIHGIRLCWQQ